MKLKLISDDYRIHLNEGIYIKDYSGLTLDDILAAKEQGSTARRGAGSGGGGLTDLYMNREYDYRDQDDPTDIVHVQPLNSAITLPVVPSDPSARRSFRGAIIHCAFAIVPSENFNDPTIESGWKIPESARRDIKELRGLINRYYVNYAIAQRDRKVVETRDDLIARRKLAERRFNEYRAENYRQELEIIDRLLGYMEKLGVNTLSDIDTETRGFESGPSRTEFTSAHLRYAAQSLAKKIKNPSNPSEQEMSEKITQAAAINLARLKQPYDIIVVPASSSNYNDRLVAAIQSQPGWSNSQVIKLSKLTGDEATNEIDWGSFVDRAEAIHQYAVMRGKAKISTNLSPAKLAKIQASVDTPLPPVDMSQPLVATQPEWIEWWVADKIAMAKTLLSRYAGRQVPIKDLASFDNYKKYLQIFKADPASLAGMQNKRVLIVDDNVNHQATIQMVHDLVRKGNPSEVLIYTPFYMKTLKLEADDLDE